MAKKDFKSGIQKPTDEQLLGAAKPTPFKKCPSCGNSIISSATYCWECKRLVELGMRDAVYQPVDAEDRRQDDQEKQSYDAFRHDGYSDTIPSAKIPPKKERM